jgi:acyl-CoA thioesterase-1
MTVTRICFFGDSVTVGTGDAECRGWPSLLSAAETAAGHDVSCYNLGVRAETCPEVARRWRAEADPRLPDHVDGRLVFMFGLNDCADFNGEGVRVPEDRSVAVARDLLCAAAAWKPTIWIGPTPVRRDPPVISPGPGVTFTFDRDRAAALNARYRTAAAEIGVPFVDLHAALVDEPAWDAVLEAGDGVHPTREGYIGIADLISRDPAWRAWFDEGTAR